MNPSLFTFYKCFPLFRHFAVKDIFDNHASEFQSGFDRRILIYPVPPPNCLFSATFHHRPNIPPSKSPSRHFCTRVDFKYAAPRFGLCSTALDLPNDNRGFLPDHLICILKKMLMACTSRLIHVCVDFSLRDPPLLQT